MQSVRTMQPERQRTRYQHCRQRRGLLELQTGSHRVRPMRRMCVRRRWRRKLGQAIWLTSSTSYRPTKVSVLGVIRLGVDVIG